MYDKYLINKENWREARGVKHDHPNSALATRDYSVECNDKYCITIIQGYWIWWCSAHHQPLAWCDIDKLKSTIDE